MISEETRRKLCEINLGEAISGLEAQQADPATIALPFDDRMQQLVDYIYQEKYNGKIQRLIKSAKLRFPQATRQGIIYGSRGLNRNLIEDLFSCQYIDLYQSVILQGFIGSGKTYLACALGKEACLNRVKVCYIRLPDLLMEYGDSTVMAGKQRKLLEHYSRVPLLILDGLYRTNRIASCTSCLNLWRDDPTAHPLSFVRNTVRMTGSSASAKGYRLRQL